MTEMVLRIAIDAAQPSSVIAAFRVATSLASSSKSLLARVLIASVAVLIAVAAAGMTLAAQKTSRNVRIEIIATAIVTTRQAALPTLAQSQLIFCP